MATIAVVEDDQHQANLLRSYLERDGHVVVVEHDGRAGLEQIRDRRPQLAILDVMMPGLSGFEVCQAIRTERLAVAVIMLTARNSDSDQIEGLDLGADDYVVKPYSMRQLMARVRAVLRRTAADDAHPGVITIGGLEIDGERFEARLDGVPVNLTPREFSLLQTLADKPGRAFTRNELLAAIAGFDHYALARTVDMHVVNLRRKLEVDPSNPTLICTVKGRGYRLNDAPIDDAR